MWRTASYLQFTTQMVAIERQQESIPMLFNGHNPVQLVPLDSIKLMIKSLQQCIQTYHSYVALLHSNSLYYYRESRFLIFRRECKRYIHVQVPLSSFEPHVEVFAWKNYRSRFVALQTITIFLLIQFEPYTF